MKNREPWNFCETPKEKCTMNYCDENGCQNRKRNYIQGNDFIADVSGSATTSSITTDKTTTDTTIWKGGYVSDNFHSYYLDENMVKHYL